MSKQEQCLQQYINKVFYKQVNKNEYRILKDGQTFVIGENDELLKRYELMTIVKLPVNKSVIEQNGELVVVEKPTKTILKNKSMESTI